MCYDEYECTDIARGWRKARKAHGCVACREEIPAGHRYHFEVQKYDDLLVFKHCARCWAIVQALLEAGAGSVQWDLKCGEKWEDNFGPLPDNVAALAFMTAAEAQELGKVGPRE